MISLLVSLSLVTSLVPAQGVAYAIEGDAAIDEITDVVVDDVSHEGIVEENGQSEVGEPPLSELDYEVTGEEQTADSADAQTVDDALDSADGKDDSAGSMGEVDENGITSAGENSVDEAQGTELEAEALQTQSSLAVMSAASIDDDWLIHCSEQEAYENGPDFYRAWYMVNKGDYYPTILWGYYPPYHSLVVKNRNSDSYQLEVNE